MSHSVRSIVLLAVAVVVGWSVVKLTGTDPIGGGNVDSFGFRVGELVDDFSFVDVRGGSGTLGDLLQDNGLVIAMRDVGCPVSKRYGHRLATFEKEFAERGIGFAYLNVSPQDSSEEILVEEIGKYGFEGRYLVDPEGIAGQALQATVSTEIFLLDRTGTLVYRGAVDDQYGIAFSLPEAREHYLRDAVKAVLDGREIEVSETQASGCFLATDHWEHHTAEVRPITYHNRVSRVVQNNCVTCHRADGVAPFSLETYEDVYGFRGMVQWVIEEQRMPPWFAAPGNHVWANDRTLAPQDRDALLAWIVDGAPEGDPGDGPVKRSWLDGWHIGTPDAVVQIEEPVAVPAEGVVDYQYVYVKTDFPEDRWVQRMEVLPTASQVTHHALVFLEEPGARRKQGGIGGFFAGMVPGHEGNVYPEGTAKLLPKGAWLKFQLHYTPNGKATFDQTKLGFIFADGPPELEVRTSSAYNSRFEIPPGAPNHEVSGEYTFREDGHLLTFLAHMHVRGKSFRYDLISPSGSEETLLDIPRYDFNWQLFYTLEEPLAISAGTTVRATGWFDNSPDNPANPDPTISVSFGEQTWDEMMIGYFDWIPARPRSERADADRAPVPNE